MRKVYNWGNWGRNLRCVDSQLGRYPGHKECGRNDGKNVRFHCDSDQTHEGTTTGRMAEWRKGALGENSDEKKWERFERSAFIRRPLFGKVFLNKNVSRICAPLHRGNRPFTP